MSHQTRKRNYVTKLLRNYLSHPTILDIPSELLYEVELIFIACKQGQSAAYVCIILPNRSFPVLLFGVNKENHLLMIALAFLIGHPLFFFFWLEIKDQMSGIGGRGVAYPILLEMDKQTPWQ
jgi:hypothetical protein